MFAWTLVALLLLTMSVSSEPVPVTSGLDAEADVDTDVTNVDSERATYDQRQSGKYNIHISIKDVAIIEMNQNELDESSYEDYYYDYSDLTVKPLPWLQNRTTTTTPTTPIASSINAEPVATSTMPLSTQSSENHDDTVMGNDTSYSPNLLAEIAATEAGNSPTHPHSPTSSSSTSSTNAKKSPNVVILTTNGPERQRSTSTHKPLPPDTITTTSIESNVPARSAFASVLLPTQLHYKTLQNMARTKAAANAPKIVQQLTGRTNSDVPLHNTDSKVYKFKMRRAGDGAVMRGNSRPTPCRHSQYRDVSGNCRSRRTSPAQTPSLIRRLFHMLFSLPFGARNDARKHQLIEDESI